MSDIAIRVEGLSKRYRISPGRKRHETLREAVVGTLASPVRNFRRLRTAGAPASADETLWALRDVSFEARQGEVLGIIGRNGAGKSTLLKILARITEPTSGRAEIHGRFGALLEVGTGFHPELTGRENVYLNGSILGMDRAYIDSRFAEIVEFSGVEKFMDTPVKRYSSGMQVRLAFAVAAHLDPEILLVDEVLAVGDAEFQRKCLRKMGQVAGEGRTVLIVSHNLGVISSLCSRSILLDEGRLVLDGETARTVQRYLASGLTGEAEVELWAHAGRSTGMKPALIASRLFGATGDTQAQFGITDEWNLELQYRNLSGQPFIGIGFGIYASSGARVAGFNTCMAQSPPYWVPNEGTVVFTVPRLDLGPGSYTITPSVGGSQKGYLYDRVEHALMFEVVESDIYGTGWLLTPDDGVHVMHARCEVRDLDTGRTWTSGNETPDAHPPHAPRAMSHVDLDG